ncbi:MAG: type I-E CRISPR-associated protein Cse2/CasB [Gallicola sp.]|nr:type I-E CRISPR-associated protein Cse2/CasB [Gallicola sp.]
MKIAKNRNKVSNVMGKIIIKFHNTLDTSGTRATLANLRNSIGRGLSDTVDVWAEVFSEMPTEFLSRNGKVTEEENAIFSALQLYALHQQGSVESVHNPFVPEYENEDQKKIINFPEDLGRSLNRLRREVEDSNSLDRRFNTMITSKNFGEIIVHLRHLIKILKGKSSIKIDYVKLAEDLYWIQKSTGEQTRLKWGQNYYSIRKEDKNNDKQ